MKKFTAWQRVLMALLAVLLALPTMAAARAEESETKLEVHFLDVGRNDGILLRFGDTTAFIDGGGYAQCKPIVAYFKKMGVDHLDYYIATHAHIDHVGVAGALFTSIPTAQVLMGSNLVVNGMNARAQNNKQKQAIKDIPKTIIGRGDSIAIGDATLTCIAPYSITRFDSCRDTGENKNSLVFRLTYGETSFVLTADATTDVMKKLIKEDPSVLTCNVLKSPHHNEGMHTDEFKVLHADYVIYSTSINYPVDSKQINKCRRTGARVLITNSYNAGDICFVSDGETVEYSCANKLGAWRLSYEKMTVKVGATKTFAKYMKPGKMIETLMYTTSDPSIATVDLGTGAIKGISPGQCTITATAFDGSSRQIQVTVKKK